MGSNPIQGTGRLMVGHLKKHCWAGHGRTFARRASEVLAPNSLAGASGERAPEARHAAITAARLADPAGRDVRHGPGDRNGQGRSRDGFRPRSADDHGGPARPLVRCSAPPGIGRRPFSSIDPCPRVPRPDRADLPRGGASLEAPRVSIVRMRAFCAVVSPRAVATSGSRKAARAIELQSNLPEAIPLGRRQRLRQPVLSFLGHLAIALLPLQRVHRTHRVDPVSEHLELGFIQELFKR